MYIRIIPELDHHKDFSREIKYSGGVTGCVRGCVCMYVHIYVSYQDSTKTNGMGMYR